MAELFFTQLEKEILDHPSICGGLAARLAAVERFDRASARRFALGYYAHILHTRRYQAHALALAPDEQVQFALAQILADEYGNGNVEATHMALYRRFMKGVGCSDEEIAAAATPLFPEARLYIDAMMAYTRCGDWLAAAAAVGIAMEWPIPALYRRFLHALTLVPGLDADALELFTSHITIDVHHSDWMRQALLPYADTPDGQARIAAGVRYNLEARWVLMEGLSRFLDAER
ncbi:MAG: iron-containing redox enzyme family protein [Hydrogenophilus sp.]